MTITIAEKGHTKNMFNFTKINDLCLGNNLVDVIAIAKESFPLTTVTSKTKATEIPKKDMILIDQTGNIRLTVWGSKAEEEFETGSVLCLKAVKLSVYNGISLSTISSTQVLPNLDIPEALDLLK